MKKQFNFRTALVAVVLSVSSFMIANGANPVYTVDQLVAQTPDLVGQTVTVKGTCEHVCTSSGKKIFLSTENGKLFRFNAGDKVDKFNRAALGKDVTITGVVTENRTYMADLEKLEARLIEAEKKKAAAAEHCSTDAKANDENTESTPLQRVRAQKDKLSKQIAAGGKDYLASYTVNGCNDYSFE